MPILDIFKDSAFSMARLTHMINATPFVPGQAGKLGVWQEKGVDTTRILIERYQGTLILIPTRSRTSAPWNSTKNYNDLIDFTVPHLPIADHITSEEVQNIRAKGMEVELKRLRSEVSERLERMVKSHDATVEYQRIGAIRGNILDADGSTVLYNLFTKFNLTQPTVDFVLGTSSTEMISKCLEVRNKTQDALGGDGGDEIDITVLCGKTFYDRFTTHATVKEAYKYYQTTIQSLNPLQQDLRYRGFRFGGLLWKRYRGEVSGVTFVPDSEGYSTPMNVPDLHITRYAPATYLSEINEEGKPRYAKQYPTDPGRDTSVTIDTQSNPISLCVRPDANVKVFTSN